MSNINTGARYLHKMNREDAMCLLVLLQKARRDMCVDDSLAFVRAAVIGGRQQPFVYDVLALCEEASEDADYDKFKALLATAVLSVSKALK